jgi:hypothetical protein
VSKIVLVLLMGEIGYLGGVVVPFGGEADGIWPGSCSSPAAFSVDKVMVAGVGLLISHLVSSRTGEDGKACVTCSPVTSSTDFETAFPSPFHPSCSQAAPRLCLRIGEGSTGSSPAVSKCGARGAPHGSDTSKSGGGEGVKDRTSSSPSLTVDFAGVDHDGPEVDHGSSILE